MAPTADPRLQELADQCVMCGLCLPHCPTYRISLDEAESPRGRIALARWLAAGRLAPGPVALAHLDQCLACLSCQKVCPSEVRYEEILTRARAAIAARRPPRGVIGRWLTRPDRLVALARIGASLKASRWIPRLVRGLPGSSAVRTIGERIPDLPRASLFELAQAPRRDRGRVILFRGCVASVYDRDTHAAARLLLEALDYEVGVPDGTPCCGALARHAGDAAAADRQSDATRSALAEAGGDIVLVSASGCFGDLRDHVTTDGAPRVAEIHGFIARDERLAQLRFRPLAARAALHLPCTQVNVAGEVPAIRALLARIPGLTVLPLPEQPRCCGAAGAYFIEHPTIADRLRAEKLDQAAAQEPDMLLTTNIGCRIHLGNGLRDRALAIPVRHPLALLAQQLDNGAS
ncbi:MAG TPA: (Fe-S)-binding protein [Rhodanobacteraceae bacterium]